MSIRILDNIFSFFKEYTEYYRSINTYPFYIQSVKKNKKDEYVVSVKIINKNTVFYANALALINNGSSLRYFRWDDVRTICYYAFIDKTTPKFQLVSDKFNFLEDGKIELKEKGKGKFSKNIHDATNDSKIINSISPLDAFTLGSLSARKEKIENNLEKEKLKGT